MRLDDTDVSAVWDEHWRECESQRRRLDHELKCARNLHATRRWSARVSAGFLIASCVLLLGSGTAFGFALLTAIRAGAGQ